MSIYDKKIGFDFFGVTKQLIPFAIGIIVLIGLVLLFAMFSEIIKPQPIAASFQDNPLDLTKSTFTKMTVTITNVTTRNAPDVQVEVIPEVTDAIIVAPAKTDLGLVEKGNKRVTEFIVRPNPAKAVKPGTYTLNVFAVINSERFQQKMVLEIKTA